MGHTSDWTMFVSLVGQPYLEVFKQALPFWISSGRRWSSERKPDSSSVEDHSIPGSQPQGDHSLRSL